jgi:plasmid stabilization system protein ParE
MSLRIVFKGAAKDELEEAAAWYNDHQRGLGEEFLNEAAEAIDRAAHHPERHPFIFRDVRRTVLRRFPYAIYFRQRDDSLVILAVFHGRRNPLVWKRRS